MILTSASHWWRIARNHGRSQRLPKPKVAGSRPVVRFPSVSPDFADLPGAAGSFAFLLRRIPSGFDGFRRGASHISLTSSGTRYRGEEVPDA